MIINQQIVKYKALDRLFAIFFVIGCFIMLRIVEFNNGKYGIQTNRFPRRFADLVNNRFSWGRGSKYFTECQGELSKCKEVMASKYAKVVRYI